MMPPTVSVVIPAYNSQKTIGKTLAAVLKQNFRGNLEIIVVDDGSNDETASIVKSFANVKYVGQKNSGPARARNLGVKNSKGEIIFFTDSDCIPRFDWIEKTLRQINGPDIAVVAGSYGIANDENLLAHCIHQEIIFRHRSRMPSFSNSFGSYNFCVKRNVFESLGGFNEDYRFPSGEDNDLSYRVRKAGFKIYFDKNILVDHFHPTSLPRYFKEQFRHGFWRVKMYLAHPDRTVGDDYTFWKDIIEPPLVLIFIAGCVLSAWNLPQTIILRVISLVILMILEFFYARIMIKNLVASLYFGLVMLLRSFARTAGFLSGMSYFSLLKFRKKI